jgi:hypothetical protein
MRGRFVGIIVVLLFFTLGWWQHRSARSSDDIDGMETWRPRTTEIAEVVGIGPGKWNDERHSKFAELFTRRYRARGNAIRVRFVGANLANLQCAATIPRWHMTRFAIQFRNEAKSVFEEECAVDVFETYITIQRRKVAELRVQPGGRLRVHFEPRFIDVPRPDRLIRQRIAWPQALPIGYTVLRLDHVPHLALPRQPGAWWRLSRPQEQSEFVRAAPLLPQQQ